MTASGSTARGRIARLVLCIAAPTLPLTAAGAQAASDSVVVRGCIEGLLEQGEPLLVERFGDQALPILVDILAATYDRGDPGRSGDPEARELAERQRAGALEALGVFETDPLVLGVRAQVLSAKDPCYRCAALEVLGRYGRPTEIEFAVRLTEELDSEESAPVTAGFERAVASILARHPESLDLVGNQLVLAPPELTVTLGRAIAQSGSPLAAECLGRTLERRPELGLTLLGLLRSAVGNARRPMSSSVCSAVRGLALGEDYQLRREAAQILGCLGDFESTPVLVEMLAAEEDALRATAHQALKQISGMEFAADPARWTLWIDAEQRWFETEGHECLQKLEDPRTPEVIAALNQLRGHRYRRFATALQLELLLEHVDVDVRKTACVVARDLAPEMDHAEHEDCALLESPEPTDAETQAETALAGAE